jgi:hypothetical protein
MGLAIDTICSYYNSPGATFQNTVVTNSSDSLTVRNFPVANRAFIHGVIRRHNTSGAVRVLSPLVHDNVTGLTWYTSETPSVHEMPPQAEQPVQPADTLVIQTTGDTTHYSNIYTGVWYENLTGASANLYMWGDISGSIKNIKPMTVAATASGTIGTWTDTVITTTENQLHASSYYAVLGMSTDTALGAIGVKGAFTANLRITCPGATSPEDTSFYFVNKANYHGRPFIPVFNGQDRGAVYATYGDNAASTTANLTLVLAELMGSNWSRQ